MDEITGDREARDGFGSIEGSYICRHHVEPRVQLHVPQEEPFPIPLKYIDVTRTTYDSGCVAKTAESMIIGTLMRIEIYRSHGQDSRSSQY